MDQKGEFWVKTRERRVGIGGWWVGLCFNTQKINHLFWHGLGVCVLSPLSHLNSILDVWIASIHLIFALRNGHWRVY